MLVQIASDLHSEWYNLGARDVAKKLKPVGDVLILAGDIQQVRSNLQVKSDLGVFCDLWKNVVYVPGNHEYYESDWGKVKEALSYAEVKLPNLHVLMNRKVEIDGRRFLGGTLWFPRKPDPHRDFELMNDFALIKSLDEWVYKENENFKNFMLSNAQPGDFIVSHHLPTEFCVSEQWKHSRLNKFFVGDAEEVVEQKKPKFWAFGHTHDRKSIIYKDTSFICNPMGYPNQRKSNSEFDPALVVEY